MSRRSMWSHGVTPVSGGHTVTLVSDVIVSHRSMWSHSVTEVSGGHSVTQVSGGHSVTGVNVES